MLVLSRKPNQTIHFPSLGISVQILRVQGSTVRVGVDAPAKIKIVRDELQQQANDKQPPRETVIRLPKELRHELRNQWNNLSIALHLFKQEIDSGHVEDAEKTFDKLVAQLEQITEHRLFSQEGLVYPQPHCRTALLVEDEINEREMLAGFLRLQGYDVTTANDGLEAIDYLERNEIPCAILMDMKMPRCDGPTTIRHIRSNPAFDPIKIYAISGTTPEENGLNLETDGVNQWFSKPLNPQLLVKAMTKVVPMN